MRYSLARLRTTVLNEDAEEILLRRFCLIDAGFFLVTTDSSAIVDKYPLFQKSRVFTLVILN